MAEKIEAIKVSLNQALNDKEKPWKKALDLAEEKSGVPRLYIFGGESSFILDVLKTHAHTHKKREQIFIKIIAHPDHVHCLESFFCCFVGYNVQITCISRNVKEKKLR